MCGQVGGWAQLALDNLAAQIGDDQIGWTQFS